MNHIDLKKRLDILVSRHNTKTFIENDPISIPHSFKEKQDIEISGFFSSIFAWGKRTNTINSCKRLIELMDNAPHDFILYHKDADLKNIDFAHRTFNTTDLLYFIEFLKQHYQKYTSLEDAFVPEKKYNYENVELALIHFHNYFFSLEDFPHRTRKHIATPERNSACKRINMYLRWMVRKGDVDFGIWKKIKPHQLVCPLDIHVIREARILGLLDNDKSNWKNAVQLTNRLKELNPNDPTVYDYALFGVGVNKHNNETKSKK